MKHRRQAHRITLGLGSAMLTACAARAAADVDLDTPTFDRGAATTNAVERSEHDPLPFAYQIDYDDDGGYAHPRGGDRDTTTPGMAVLLFDVDQRLALACPGLVPTYYFELDSTNVPREVDAELEDLAHCLDEEALRARTVVVVGYADETGPAPYNDELGLRRASAVARELARRGVDMHRIHLDSAGESQADDPGDWDDRRVVVRLR